MKRDMWLKRVEQWQASGVAVTKWCEDNKISRSAFYHWRKIILNPKPYFRCFKKSSFVEIARESSSEPCLEINIQGISISLANDFDADILLRFLNVMRKI